jgi:hypothetical protein
MEVRGRGEVVGSRGEEVGGRGMKVENEWKCRCCVVELVTILVIFTSR